MAAAPPVSEVTKLHAPVTPAARYWWLKWVLPLALGLGLRIIPVPSGLTANAWHFFALFAAVIAGLIAEPLPGPAVGFIGVTIAALWLFVGKTPTEAMRWSLSGFSNDTVWLIFAANMFALGYEATGLGRRIALLLVKFLGKRTLGLGYAIALADLALAPFMPSNTARSGGTIYPVVKNIPPLYGSTPDKNPRKIGSYLMWTGFATTNVTSSMFLTALAPNLLAIELARKIAHVDITWTAWFLGFLPVGILLFAATPLLTYILYPPEVKRGAEVVIWAGHELQMSGRITRREITMALLALAALTAWIFGSHWVTPVTVAMAVISLMIITKVVGWSDIAANKQAWSVLVWFATLVAMADGLNSVGFLKWFADRTVASLTHIPPLAMMISVVAVFFLIHYLFASSTAHTAAVLPVFLAAMVAIPGIPTRAITLMLVYSLGLMGVITPYATGPSPIWYGSGYIAGKDFWRLGLIMGVVYLAVLLIVGLPYVLRFA
jgi:L-tartrate/succinate antiporter